MSSMQTIPKAPPERPSMDVEALRTEGIQLLERLSGHAWTDFNTHDPGVTLLEALSYALTELGYRVEHPMADLLAGTDDIDLGLTGPAAALTSEPVTLTDLRRLILDVNGVRNAWVEPIAEPSPALVYHEGEKELRLAPQGAGTATDRYATPVRLRGLVRVLVAPSAFADLDGTTVRRNVNRRLHAHRPLCTDFDEIRMLNPESIRVFARIEIAEALDPAQLLGRIHDVASACIAPSPRFRTLAERLASGQPVDEIFEGPRLDHGFLDAEELSRLSKRSALHTSDLLREIMDIPGVRAVHDLKLASPLVNSGKPEPWTLPLSPERAPSFDYQASSIVLVRDGIEILLDQQAVRDAHVTRMRAAAAPRVLTTADLDRVVLEGKDRKLDRYTSILHLLPAVYGAGPGGLPESASPERKAMQKQLRGYALFFDQVLCNSFAQLGQARKLLSLSGDVRTTYASNPVTDESLDLDQVRQKDASAHAAWLQTTLQNPAKSRSSVERSHRFLDHLLARIGEATLEYTPNTSSGQTRREALARDKQAFLRANPRIGAARGAGFDLTLPPGPENKSGLGERIERALALDPTKGERFLLIEHILLRPIEEDKNQLGEDEIRPIPLLAAAGERDPYSGRLSFVFPSSPLRFNETAFRALIEKTVRSETPAHLVPAVYWLSQNDFSTVETAIVEWLDFYREARLDKVG